MDGFSDLAFFSLLVQRGSLAAAAQELGVTPPAVSKRLAALEKRLGVRLLQRTTRRMGLTQEGETYLVEGARVLEELAALESAVAGSRASPRGLLRVGASLGFGRKQLAPVLSDFSRAYPDVELQLHLSHGGPGAGPALDLEVRFGDRFADLPDARLTARLLARNERVLCAAPAYLRRAGPPTQPRELARHACLFIRESDETYGTWHLRQGGQAETVKVRGPLSSNDGESVLAWALDGQGILMRSRWDTAALLRSGRLQQVLPDWSLPPADIHLLYPAGPQLPAKTRALVDFLLQRFEPHRGKDAGGNW